MTEQRCDRWLKKNEVVLVDWLGHPEFESGAALVKGLVGPAGLETLAAAVTQLEKRLFKKAGGRDVRTSWQGEALYRELSGWRKRSAKTKGATSSEESVLAPLNPN
jgi:hypothetical protein